MSTDILHNARRALAERLRSARARAGWTQAGLGGRLDPPVPNSTVSRWERGDTGIELPRLEQLARVLDQPLAYFLAEPSPHHVSTVEEFGREVLQAAARRGLLAADAVPVEVVAVPILDAAGTPGPRTLAVPRWMLGADAREPALLAIRDDGMRARGIVAGDHAILDVARPPGPTWELAAIARAGEVALRCARLRDGALEVRGDDRAGGPPATTSLGVMIGLLATGARDCPPDADPTPGA